MHIPRDWIHKNLFDECVWALKQIPAHRWQREAIQFQFEFGQIEATYLQCRKHQPRGTDTLQLCLYSHIQCPRCHVVFCTIEHDRPNMRVHAWRQQCRTNDDITLFGRHAGFSPNWMMLLVGLRLNHVRLLANIGRSCFSALEINNQLLSIWSVVYTAVLETLGTRRCRPKVHFTAFHP